MVLREMEEPPSMRSIVHSFSLSTWEVRSEKGRL